jgi:serine/threonine protein kinase
MNQPPDPKPDATLPNIVGSEQTVTYRSLESPSGRFESPPLERVKIPGYEILEELGRGGMGVVYKARQTSLKRLVALKMILIGIHNDKEILARFRTEAEAVAKFLHPNIVQIYEIGTAELPYFSLEYVEGGSLSEYLKHRFPAAREAAVLAEQIARAVDDAHRKSIIHRDLKPANVLLSPKRKGPEAEETKGLKKPLGEYIPKITDFGLAKNLSAESHTARGKMMGTPSYMAPEQAGGVGAGNIGPATDIYALGAILYEMLTGRPPFRAATPLETMLQVTTVPPPPPRAIRPDVPPELEAIALKCLAKKQRDRYPSARAMADDLQHYLEGGKVQAMANLPAEAKGGATAPPASTTANSQVIVWLTVAAVAAAAGLAAYFLFLR